MKRGYLTSYTKSAYSRGAMRMRDAVYEAIIARACATCGNTLTRKVSRSGVPESLQRFRSRKTCGNVWNEKENKYMRSNCYNRSIDGEGNPKWRGGLPICKDCGIKTSWYKTKKSPQNYCKKCFNKRLVIIAKENGIKRRGTQPKALIPYFFRKGMVAKNKLYEDYTQCDERGCVKKPIAKSLCKSHYEKIRKKQMMYLKK